MVAVLRCKGTHSLEWGPTAQELKVLRWGAQPQHGAAEAGGVERRRGRAAETAATSQEGVLKFIIIKFIFQLPTPGSAAH